MARSFFYKVLLGQATLIPEKSLWPLSSHQRKGGQRQLQSLNHIAPRPFQRKADGCLLV